MEKLFDDGDKKKRREPKQPDPIWDCLAAMFYPSGVPSMARGKMNKVVKDLKMLGATPQSIKERARKYRKEWPKMACTPCALVLNWDAFPPEKPTLQPGIPMENQAPETQRRYREWHTWAERTGNL